MRILYIGGGSGGHLAPLVAVERAVHELEPKAKHLFVCTETEDDIAFLKQAAVRYQTLPLPRHPLRHPITLLQSLGSARAIIETFKPDAIFSKGGIVSIPLGFIAHRKKIPIVLHESDAVMGRANRVIAKWAEKVCVGFPMKDMRCQMSDVSKKETDICDLKSEICVLTGNPLRPHITDGSKAEGLRITGLSGKRPILLIIGGSQGAQALNDAIEENIDLLLAQVDIVHLTGRKKKTSINKTGYWQTEFAYEELPHLYAIADMALSRAGAGAITELASNGIPMILVPIEGLANNHQVLNAITAQENGGCILLLQSHLASKLPKVIGDLLENPERRTEISQNVRSLYKASAAGHIAEIIIQCVARERVRH